MKSKQREDESLYNYKLRIQELLRQAYPHSSAGSTDIGVEIFLRGMSDKVAALAVVQKEPKNLDKAYTTAKSMIVCAREWALTRNHPW